MGARVFEDLAGLVGPAVGPLTPTPLLPGERGRGEGGRRQRMRQDFAAHGAEAVETALAGGHEQAAVGGQQVDRPALDGRLPGDSRPAAGQRAIHGEDSADRADAEARGRRRQCFDARQRDDDVGGQPGRVSAWSGEMGHVEGSQLGRRGSEERVAVQHGMVADGAEVGSRGEIEGAAAVDEEIMAGDDLGAAAQLGIVGQAEVQQFAGAAVIARRDGSAAGDQQPVADDGETALRGDAAEGIDHVRLLDVEGAVAAVGPADGPGARVEGVEEYAHERPDSGGEIDHRPAVRFGDDDRRPAGRPG